jgi:hypothetical protein
MSTVRAANIVDVKEPSSVTRLQPALRGPCTDLALRSAGDRRHSLSCLARLPSEDGEARQRDVVAGPPGFPETGRQR